MVVVGLCVVACACVLDSKTPFAVRFSVVARKKKKKKEEEEEEEESSHLTQYEGRVQTMGSEELSHSGVVHWQYVRNNDATTTTKRVHKNTCSKKTGRSRTKQKILGRA